MSIEAMKQALEALEGLIKRTSGQAIYSFMETDRRIAMAACVGLRQAIEQAEKQEPVAWVDEMAKVPDHVWEPPFRFRRFVAGSERAQDVVIERETTIEAAARKAAKICPPSPMTVLVYAPPTAQREWVGLTDEDVAQFETWYDDEEERKGWVHPKLVADYFEAKLKEKNT